MASPKHQILIVDDEADIHSVTQLGLRGVKYKGKPCQFLSAHTGAEAVEMVAQNPHIAVILLDVVMETDHAGLEACRSIREDLGNHFVRIILRTGQPGSSPEKETIDSYDIDGYLAKTEITSARLYSSVRTALKAYDELMDLERHKESLALIHDCAMSVHSFEPLQPALDRILGVALTLGKCDIAVLSLETFEESKVPSSYLLHLGGGDDGVEEYVAAVVKEANQLVSHDEAALQLQTSDGVVFPFALHRELGHGWLYLETQDLDELQQQAMTVLCGHAANVLYSTVAQGMLMARQDQVEDFDVMSI